MTLALLQAMQEIHKLRMQISRIVQSTFPGIDAGFVPKLAPPNETQVGSFLTSSTASHITNSDPLYSSRCFDNSLLPPSSIKSLSEKTSPTSRVTFPTTKLLRHEAFRIAHSESRRISSFTLHRTCSMALLQNSSFIKNCIELTKSGSNVRDLSSFLSHATRINSLHRI